jgi:hypothetical protein
MTRGSSPKDEQSRVPTPLGEGDNDFLCLVGHSSLALTLAEREEISRALVAGDALRSIATAAAARYQSAASGRSRCTFR